MKSKHSRKSWQLASFLILTAIVIIACGGSPDPTATSQPVQVQPTQQPTKEPFINPTNTTEPFVFPTSEETQEVTEEVSEDPAWYFEDWDDDNSAWSVYTETNGSDGDLDEIDVYIENSLLKFEMDKWLYGYVLYDPWLYEDVRIDLVSENRGANTFTTSIICRYSEEGYYVVDISSGGLYTIYAYDAYTEEYYSLANGGSTYIKQGKDTNTYTWICEGRDLTLGVNGYEVKTFTDNKYVFKEGLVGVGVTSYDIIPIKVEIDYVEISQP